MGKNNFTQSQDIGSPNLSGSSEPKDNGYIIHAAGRDIWSTSDQFHYVYSESGTQDTISISARITSVSNTNIWTKAGVMIRESTDPGSKHVLAAVRPDGQVFMQWRGEAGSNAQWSGKLLSTKFPVWLKLTKENNQYKGYYSQDGSKWTKLVGTQTFSMDPTLAGLALTSHNMTERCAATFDDVKLSGTMEVVTSNPISNNLMTPQSESNNQVSTLFREYIKIIGQVNSINDTDSMIDSTARDVDANVDFFINSPLLSPYRAAWNIKTAPFNATFDAACLLFHKAQVQLHQFLVNPGYNIQAQYLLKAGEYTTVFSLLYHGIASFTDISNQTIDQFVDSFKQYFDAKTKAGQADTARMYYKSALNLLNMPPPQSESEGNNPVCVLFQELVEVFKQEHAKSNFDTIVILDGFARGIRSDVRYFILDGEFNEVAKIWNVKTAPFNADLYDACFLFYKAQVQLHQILTNPEYSIQAQYGREGKEGEYLTVLQLLYHNIASFTDIPGQTIDQFVSNFKKYFPTGTATQEENATTYYNSALNLVNKAKLNIFPSNSNDEAAAIIDSGNLMKSEDIGSPAVAGSSGEKKSGDVNVSFNSITVISSSSGIGSTSDQFHYVYNRFYSEIPLDISACVSRIRTNAPDAAACNGVMIRESTQPDSAFVMVRATDNNTINMECRSVTGGNAGFSKFLSIKLPVWIRIKKEGDIFTGYYSSDGLIWTPFADTFPSVSMKGNLAGLVGSSHNGSLTTTGTFQDVKVYAPHFSSSKSIGESAYGGPVIQTGTETLVNVKSSDIRGTADSFYYQYNKYAADSQIEIISRVTHVLQSDSWAKAGVMIRESTDPSSKFVFAMVKPNGNILQATIQWRTDNGGLATLNDTLTPDNSGSIWLKLLKAGAQFTGHYSTDGATWSPFENVNMRPIEMETVLGGFAVSSNNVNNGTQVKYDNVSVDAESVSSSTEKHTTLQIFDYFVEIYWQVNGFPGGPHPNPVIESIAEKVQNGSINFGTGKFDKAEYETKWKEGALDSATINFHWDFAISAIMKNQQRLTNIFSNPNFSELNLVYMKDGVLTLSAYKLLFSLMHYGIFSSFDITAAPSIQFIEKFSSYFDNNARLMNLFYDSALNVRSQVMLQYMGIHSATSGGRTKIWDNYSQLVHKNYSHLPNYQTLFNRENHIHVDEFQSVLSPGAYLVDLEKNREHYLTYLMSETLPDNMVHIKASPTVYETEYMLAYGWGDLGHFSPADGVEKQNSIIGNPQLFTDQETFYVSHSDIGGSDDLTACPGIDFSKATMMNSPSKETGVTLCFFFNIKTWGKATTVRLCAEMSQGLTCTLYNTNHIVVKTLSPDGGKITANDVQLTLDNSKQFETGKWYYLGISVGTGDSNFESGKWHYLGVSVGTGKSYQENIVVGEASVEGDSVSVRKLGSVSQTETFLHRPPTQLLVCPGPILNQNPHEGEVKLYAQNIIATNSEVLSVEQMLKLAVTKFRDPAISLERRRPDIFELPLTENNTEEEIPKLEIVNHVLEAQLAVRLGLAQDEIKQNLNEKYPLNAPYNYNLTKLRAGLSLLGTDFGTVTRGITKPSDGLEVAWANFELSPSMIQLLKTPVATVNELFERYGLGYLNGTDLTQLTFPLFQQSTGLEGSDITDLIFDNLSDHEINHSNPQSRFYINKGSNTLGLKVDPDNSDAYIFENESMAVMDRINRLIRLRSITGLSFMDLNSILMNAGLIQSGDVLSADSTYRYLDTIRNIMEYDSVSSVNMAVAAVGLLKDFGQQSGSTFIQSVFGDSAPNYGDTPLSWNPSNPTGNDQQISADVMKGSGVSQDDLTMLVNYVGKQFNYTRKNAIVNNFDVTLNQEFLSAVYRVAISASLFNLSIESFLFVLNALASDKFAGPTTNLKTGSQISLDRYFEGIQSFMKKIGDTDLTMEDIQFINNYDSKQNESLSPGTIATQALVDQISKNITGTMLLSKENFIAEMIKTISPSLSYKGKSGKRYVKSDLDAFLGGIYDKQLIVNNNVDPVSTVNNVDQPNGTVLKVKIDLTPTSDLTPSDWEIVTKSIQEILSVYKEKQDTVINTVFQDVLSLSTEVSQTVSDWGVLFSSGMSTNLFYVFNLAGQTVEERVRQMEQAEVQKTQAILNAVIDPVNCFGALKRFALMVNGLRLSEQEVRFIVEGNTSIKRPEVGQAFGVTLEALLDIIDLRQLVMNYPDPDNRLLLFLTPVKDQSDPKQNLSDLLAVTYWKEPAVYNVLKAWGITPSGSEGQYTLSTIQPISLVIAMRSLFALSLQTGLSTDDLLSIASVTNNDYSAIAAKTMQAVYARNPGESSTAIRTSLLMPIEELYRDVLVDSVLHQYRDASSGVLNAVQDRNSLSEYLLTDVEVSGKFYTSKVKEAIGAYQTYFHRLIMNMEPGASLKSVFVEKYWDWFKNYRVWEANRRVFLTPENYLEPDLRKNASEIFKNFQNTLQQGEVNDVNINNAFSQYLVNFTTIANLKIITGYYYEVDPEDGNEVSFYLFLLGYSSTSGEYYYRKLILSFAGGHYSPLVWEPWKKLDLKISTKLVKLIYAFNRLFVFWVEYQVNEKVADNKNPDGDNLYYTNNIKYSYYQTSGTWSPAQNVENGSQVTSTNIKSVTNAYTYQDYVLFCEKLNSLELRVITKEPHYADYLEIRYHYNDCNITAKTPVSKEIVFMLSSNMTIPSPYEEVNKKDNDNDNNPDVSPAVMNFNPSGDSFASPVPNDLKKASISDFYDSTYKMPYASEDSYHFLTNGTTPNSGKAMDIDFSKFFDIDRQNPTYTVGGWVYIRSFSEEINLLNFTSEVPALRTERASQVVQQITLSKTGLKFYPGGTAPFLNHSHYSSWDMTPKGFSREGYPLFFSQGDYFMYDKSGLLWWFDEGGSRHINYTDADEPPSKPKSGVAASIASKPFSLSTGKWYFFSVSLSNIFATGGDTNKMSYYIGEYASNKDGHPAIKKITSSSAPISIGGLGNNPVLLGNSLDTMRIGGGVVGGLQGTVDKQSMNYLITSAPDQDLSLNIQNIFLDNTYVENAEDLSVYSGFPLFDSSVTPVNKNTPITYPFKNSNQIKQSIVIDHSEKKFHIMETLHGAEYLWMPASSSTSRFVRLSASSVAPTFDKAFLNGGVDHLLQLVFQLVGEDNFADLGPDTAKVPEKYWPIDGFLDIGGSNGVYYWELFFFSSWLIAKLYHDAGDYASAKKWYQYVFNPTKRFANLSAKEQNQLEKDGNLKDMYWGFIGLQSGFNPTLRSELFSVSDEVDNAFPEEVAGPSGTTFAISPMHNEAVDAYYSDPFDPFAIANLRPKAYQEAIVTRYIQNLLDWADSYYLEETRESIIEAITLYQIVENLLGDQSKAAGDFSPPQDESKLTLKAIQEKYKNSTFTEGLIPEFLVGLEANVKLINGSLSAGDSYTHYNFESALYFGIPENERISNLRETVNSRLNNIRNNLDIHGNPMSLALFQPAINPMILVEAVANASSSSVSNHIYANTVPNYRFMVQLGRAQGFASQVSQFGQLLLSVIERKDSEALALLQVNQQANIINMTLAIKKDQFDASRKNVESLRNSCQGVLLTKLFYQGLIDWDNKNVASGSDGIKVIGTLLGANSALSGNKKISDNNEDIGISASFNFNNTAIARMKEIVSDGTDLLTTYLQLGSALLAGFSAPSYLTPTIFGTSNGGQNPGGSLQTASQVLSSLAFGLNFASGSMKTGASYERRRTEWHFQLQQAESQFEQLKSQWEAAQYQLDIAQQDYLITNKQIAQNTEILKFYQNKFTNEELFRWMKGQLTNLYYQSYKLAVSCAQDAQTALEYEKGLEMSSLNIVNKSSWNSTNGGLLAAEPLLHSLNELEKYFMDTDQQRLEITKTISLKSYYELNPVTEDGVKIEFVPYVTQVMDSSSGGGYGLIFTLKKNLFDLDYPGHYLRQIKNLTISLPAVLAPYQNIHATLTQTKNSITINTEDATKNNSRHIASPSPQIAISRGLEESGLFSLNFGDPRYLPFEGTGVEDSKWNLYISDLDENLHGKDTSISVSDILITLRYTSVDGDNTFKNTVIGTVKSNKESFVTFGDNQLII